MPPGSIQSPGGHPVSISSANRLYRGTEACVLDGAECQRVLGANDPAATAAHGTARPDTQRTLSSAYITRLPKRLLRRARDALASIDPHGVSLACCKCPTGKALATVKA